VLYHCPVHSLAERVLGHIRRQELLRAGDRVGVAVSGGIDSVALLRLLLELRGELGIVLSVVHFNHKLRGEESDADEKFVAELAREHDLEFLVDGDDVAEHAREEGVSVEAAARELRYGFFRCLIGEGRDPGLKPSVSEVAPGRGPEGPLFHGDGRSRELPARDTAEAVPLPKRDDSQGLKPDPTVTARGAAGSRALSKHDQAVRVKIPTLSLQKTQGQGWGTRSSGNAEAVLPHLDKVATGHTLDDQAETVLMRMIRGAGMRGLGGIYPRIPVEDDEGEICGEIVRPLLAIRRRELEQYLNDVGQTWREDSSNTDARLTRNRVRKLVVPLLEKEFNPAVAESLAELAEIARGEEDYWENEVAGWMGTTVHWSEPEWARDAGSRASLVQIASAGDSGPQGLKPPTPDSGPSRGPEGPLFHGASSADLQSKIASAPWAVMNASVSRLWLLGEPVAVQRRVIKAVGEQAGIPLGFKHVEEILRFAAEDAGAGRELSLPLGWKASRDPEEIVFLTPDLRQALASQDYEYELPIPGTIVVNETGTQIEVLHIPADAVAEYNPQEVLDAASLRGPLKVRNWRPGDRFWPAHTKSPKKVKELLQERHVAQPERRSWPVAASGNEIVWVRGFPAPAKLRAAPGREAIRIVERPLAGTPTA